MSSEHIHFVTGRLAEPALREVVAGIAPQAGFDYTIDVLGISVAALMTADWVAQRIRVPDDADRVLLPGECRGDLGAVESAAGCPVQLGPGDLRQLPEFFDQGAVADDYGAYTIEILAEINLAPHLPTDRLLTLAAELRRQGADVIDFGCVPGEPSPRTGELVRALVEAGHRVSIDTTDTGEIAAAAAAGAELVLSVNSKNRSAAADWGCEVVVVPDEPSALESIEPTLEHLETCQIPFRVDPVMEPIGFGFAASLGRYLEARRRWPDAAMMMGIGNLTELTDVDSAGINVLLMGFCAELGINSVLTTQVINWARTSVAECDLARRLVHYAVSKPALPKHREPRLVALRDPRIYPLGGAEIERLARAVSDHNVRIFAEEGQLHVVAGGEHHCGSDPFELFDRLCRNNSKRYDRSHAFYLGFELAKALTALTLDKQYRQDQPLDWGYLTREEDFHRLPRGRDSTD